MYYTTEELFALAERLDKEIALLEKNVKSLSDLKAYRAHVQEGIEASIASVENQTGE